MNVTAAAHLTFEPRTSLAGRRARSIRAATLSAPSMALAKTISRRVRGERSFHFFLLTIGSLTGLTGWSRVLMSQREPVGSVNRPRGRCSGYAARRPSSGRSGRDALERYPGDRTHPLGGGQGADVLFETGRSELQQRQAVDVD